MPSSSSHAWSLADQFLVSGCNFIIGILLARMLGLEDFGAYVIGLTYLLYANTFQASLVVSPMMTTIPAEESTVLKVKLIRGFFGYALLVAISTTLIIQILAGFLGIWFPVLNLGGLQLPMVVAVFSFLMQDWCRRLLYAQVKNRAVFISDIFAYGGQLVFLVFFAWQGQLDSALAFWLLATTFSFSAMGIIVTQRLIPDSFSTKQVIRSQLNNSKNFLVSWQLQWVGSSGVVMVGVGMIGLQAAAAIKAVQNLLGPINVFFQWMDNAVLVRSANILRADGKVSLNKYLAKITSMGLVGLSLFTLLLFIFDEWLIVSIYGEEYRAFAGLVVLQGLYFIFGHAYRVRSYFYRVFEQTAVLAKASFWWAITSVTFAIATVPWMEEEGIMLSMIVGEVAALIFLLLVHHGDGDVHNIKHVVIQKNGSSTKLFLPMRNARVMRSALKMYYPSRWTGRLYRTAMSVFLPGISRLGLKTNENDPTSWCPHLATVIQQLPEASLANVGALVGQTGPWSKFTLKVMRENGDALAYGRIAFEPKAIQVLEDEVAVLDMLSQSAVAEQIPNIIAHGRLTEPDAMFMLESAGPEKPSQHQLSKQHFSFLSGLLTVNHTVSAQDFLTKLDHDLKPLKSIGSVIDKAMTYLRGLDNYPILIVPEHGDFTPWNIRTTEHDELFVLDWEHSRLEGVPWMDALHFTYQIETLVNRHKIGTVLSAMQAVFSLDIARSYANELSCYQGKETELIMIYLLKMINIDEREGKLAAGDQYIARCQILEMLLKVEINDEK